MSRLKRHLKCADATFDAVPAVPSGQNATTQALMVKSHCNVNGPDGVHMRINMVLERGRKRGWEGGVAGMEGSP